MGEEEFTKARSKGRAIQRILTRSAYGPEDKFGQGSAKGLTLGILDENTTERALATIASPFSKKAEGIAEAHQMARSAINEYESKRDKGGVETGAEIATSLLPYGAIAKGVRGLTKFAPKAVEKIAITHPHLWDATVGNVLESGIEAGVKKATNQNYDMEDFLLSLSMNAAGEGVAKGVKTFFDKSVPGGFKKSDLDTMNEVVAMEYRRNPSATPAEIRQSIASVPLSNGKTVDEMYMDFSTRKLAGESNELGVSVKDMAGIKQGVGG